MANYGYQQSDPLELVNNLIPLMLEQKLRQDYLGQQAMVNQRQAELENNLQLGRMQTEFGLRKGEIEDQLAAKVKENTISHLNEMAEINADAKWRQTIQREADAAAGTRTQMQTETDRYTADRGYESELLRQTQLGTQWNPATKTWGHDRTNNDLASQGWRYRESEINKNNMGGAGRSRAGSLGEPRASDILGYVRDAIEGGDTRPATEIADEAYSILSGAGGGFSSLASMLAPAQMPSVTPMTAEQTLAEKQRLADSGKNREWLYQSKLANQLGRAPTRDEIADYALDQNKRLQERLNKQAGNSFGGGDITQVMTPWQSWREAGRQNAPMLAGAVGAAVGQPNVSGFADLLSRVGGSQFDPAARQRGREQTQDWGNSQFPGLGTALSYGQYAGEFANPMALAGNNAAMLDSMLDPNKAAMALAGGVAGGIGAKAIGSLGGYIAPRVGPWLGSKLGAVPWSRSQTVAQRFWPGTTTPMSAAAEASPFPSASMASADELAAMAKDRFAMGVPGGAAPQVTSSLQGNPFGYAVNPAAQAAQERLIRLMAQQGKVFNPATGRFVTQ